MKRIATILVTIVALTGCTTSNAEQRVERTDTPGCDASGVQDRIGRTATLELGAELLAATGAKTLRWAPPRSAMTMDYRPDRLTVSYDDTLVIDRISCG